MNGLDELQRRHETLGNRYRLLMRLHGVRGPTVGWETRFGYHETVALIFWDESPGGAIEEVRAPLPSLAAAVSERVLARMGSGN